MSKSIIVIALGFLALALTYSARAVLGLAMPVWETEIGWSRAFTSNVAAIALVIMAVIAPLSGIMLARMVALLGCRFVVGVAVFAFTSNWERASPVVGIPEYMTWLTRFLAAASGPAAWERCVVPLGVRPPGAITVPSQHVSAVVPCLVAAAGHTSW